MSAHLHPSLTLIQGAFPLLWSFSANASPRPKKKPARNAKSGSRNQQVERPKKILVVEDHADSREILVFQLRRMSFKEIIEAANGEDGIEKASSEKPDIIIMDLGLPGVNGIEATMRLKQNPQTAGIPVIALTAWREEDFKDKALDAGMAEYLTKPTPPQVLKQLIERILQTRP